MDATELKKENERLKTLLANSQRELRLVSSELDHSKSHHEAVAEQFTESLKEKRQQVASLEHQLKLLLEREIIRHELSLAGRACPDCGETRDEIGVESSEQLELIPARLKAIQHDRVKYACRGCQERVVIADKPPQPIEKGLSAPGLCAHTVLSKFDDHQPMYRQEDIHSRLGMTIRLDGTVDGTVVCATGSASALRSKVYCQLTNCLVEHGSTSPFLRLRESSCQHWPSQWHPTSKLSQRVSATCTFLLDGPA